MVGCQPGCVREQAAILNHWASQTYNAGCYNPNSMLDDGHTPSPHALGQAYDIGIQPAFRGRNSTGQAIFMWLYEHRVALGIVQLIYTEQIWAASHGDAIRTYTVNPHFDHIHVQLVDWAYNNANIAIPAFPGGAPEPTPTTPPLPNQGEDMYVEYNGETHRFWKNLDTGEVGHAWPGGFENLTKAKGFEPMSTKGDLEVHLSPAPGLPILHVGGYARSGSFLEYKFWGAWVAEVWPKP